MPQGKVTAFLRSLPGQTSALYWLPGQLMANNKLYRPEEPLHKKFEFFFRRKAIWEMAALSATICGIEFCYAAETAYVSPVLRLLGTPTYFTSMVWGCSPILGVFITPIFGSLSDACNSRFGRRRPFIVALSLIVLTGLALIATAVSVAQKTESDIMAKYANETTSVTETSPAFTLMRNSRLSTSTIFYPAETRRRKLSSSSTTTMTSTTTTKRQRGPLWNDSSTTTLPHEQQILEEEEEAEAAAIEEDQKAEQVKEEDEREELQRDSASSAERWRRSVGSAPRVAGRRQTTTLPAAESWSTDVPEVIRNMEEALGESSMATTETPPTAAAVHQLPIGMAILGVILMDFGCDSSQSPCRTYLLDVCLPEDHRLGLRTFTVSAGLGGTIGYLMGGLDLSSASGGDTAAVFFQHLRVVYTIIGVLFILFVCSTIFVFQEPTLEEWRDLQAIATASQEAAEREVHRTSSRGPYRKLNRKSSRKLQSGMALKAQPKQPERLPLMATKSCSDAMQQFQVQRDAYEIDREESEQQLQEEAACNNNNNPNYNTNQNDVSRTKSCDKNELDRLNAPRVVASEPKEPTFLMYLRSIRHMPRSVGLVCLTNYFSWMSLVCYSLYFTDFVGEVVFDGDATAAYGMPKRLTYEEGVRFGACGMSLYSFTCCIYSLFAERIYKKIGLRYTYALGPSLYSLGMVTLVLVRAKWSAIFLSMTAGLMYSTLFTMPYILIGKYHSHQMFEKVPSPNDAEQQHQQLQQQMSETNGYSQLQSPSSNGPPMSPSPQQRQRQQQQQFNKPAEIRGLGTDIALVSSMVFLAQFTVALLAGPISHAADSPIVVFVMGALSSAMTAILSLRLYYPS